MLKQSSFIFACTFNRVDNVKFWLKRVSRLESRSLEISVVGGVALGCACYMGPNRLEVDKVSSRNGMVQRLETLIHTEDPISLLRVCKTKIQIHVL